MKAKKVTMKRMLALVFALVLTMGEFGFGTIPVYAAEQDVWTDSDIISADEYDDVSADGYGEIADEEANEASDDEEANDGISDEETYVDELTDDESGSESEEAGEGSEEELLAIETEDPDEELSGSIEAEGYGAVAEYDLWVGSTQVTSANCTDLSAAVEGEGATASYDPTTKTLTLNNVTGINGVADPDWYKALIFCKEDSLKLRGNAILVASSGKGVVGLNCNLDIAGTFAIVAYSFGVYTNAGYGLTVSGEDTRIEVTSGTFDAINTYEYKQSGGKVLVAGKENGLYAGKAVIDGGVLSATGEEYAIKVSGDTEEDIVINDKLSITNPENGTVSIIEDYVTIVDEDEEPADYVSIEEASPYKLYVGSVPVTEKNKGNIPGVTGEKGAKASYDPKTNTLTLDKVTGVKGTYFDPYWRNNILISSGSSLKIRGNAKLTNEEGSVIWARKGLDIEGQFELTGKGETVYCAGLLSVGGKDTNIKITSDDTAILCGMSGSSYVQNGGTVELSGDNFGLYSDGDVTVNNGTLIVNTDDTAILASGEFELGSGVEITTPEGGSIVSTTYKGSTHKTIIDQEFTVAKNVVIEPKTEKYDLWIGENRVTGLNKDNIPGIKGTNAKATYDPETKTLTFSGEVTGVTGTHGSAKYLIYAEDDLTIAGDATLTGRDGSGTDNDKGIFTYGDLTIMDELSLENVGVGINVFGTYSDINNINVRGSLTIHVPATYTDSPGIDCMGNITIEGGNVNVEMLGSNKTAIQGYTTNCLKMTSGSLTATTTSNNSAINVGNVEMSGGNLTAATKSNYQPALKVSKGLSVTGGVIEASNAGLTRTAVEAQTITLGPKVMIVEPYGGIVKNVTDSGQNYDRIFNADGSKVAPYAIITDTDPAKYACVSFMSNGEEVGVRYVAKGTGLSAFIADPTNAPETGDRFLGWFHDEKFMDRADLNDVYTVDSTLYAKWAASGTELYTVTFYTSGRVDNIPDQIVEAGGKVTQPVIPTVVGNEVFLYWYNSADAAQPYDFDAPVTSDLELVSMWKTIDPDGFTIEFVDGEYDDDHYWYNETTKHWELTYNGKPRTLSDEMLKVYSAEGEMVRGVDYTVSFKNNTKASTAKKTATVIVKGKGLFKGKKIIKYYIVPRAAVDEDGKLDETHGFRMDPIIVQSGKKISPVIYYKSMKLTSKDYKLSYTGKAKATTDKVTITFTGNFRGVLKDQPVTVLTKKEIDANAIKVSFKAGTHTYTPSDDDENQYCVPQTVSITKEEGDPKVINKGELTVKNSKGEILVEGTHFNVRYFDNKNAGTAKVVISAIAPYTGMVTKTFKISPNKSIPLILSAKPDADADIRYVPGGVKPADRIGVDINNTVDPYKELTHTTLEQGRDYKITWKNNKAVTTDRKQASYKVTFIGNYKGHSSFNGTFSIKKADFVTNANQMISVNAPDQVYTGKKKYQSAPLVMLTDHSDGSSSLLSSKDYNVRYFTTEDGVEKDITGQKITLGADEDVKLIRMELTGKGNFNADKVSKYYYVRKKAAGVIDLSKAKIAAKGNKKRKAVGAKAYTGAPITPEIDVYVKSGKKWVLVNPSTYTVTYVNNTNKGKATILVTGRGATAVGSKSAKFKIVKRSLAGFLARLIPTM